MVAGAVSMLLVVAVSVLVVVAARVWRYSRTPILVLTATTSVDSGPQAQLLTVPCHLVVAAVEAAAPVQLLDAVQTAAANRCQCDKWQQA